MGVGVVHGGGRHIDRGVGLIAAWGLVLPGIGFSIIQHIPEHTKQLERIAANLTPGAHLYSASVVVAGLCRAAFGAPAFTRADQTAVQPGA